MNVLGLKNTGKVIAYYNPSLQKTEQYSFYNLITKKNDNITPVNFDNIIFGKEYSYDFTNIENYLSIPNEVVPFDTKAFSFSFKLIEETNPYTIIQIPGKLTINIRFGDGNRLSFLSTTKKMKSTTKFIVGNIYNVYVDFYNGIICINDATNTATNISNSWSLDGGESIRIGRGNYGGYYSARFNLYEFAFYNETLTQEEINTLFLDKTIGLSEKIKSSVKDAIVNHEFIKYLSRQEE